MSKITVNNKEEIFALVTRLKAYFDSGKTAPLTFKVITEKPERSSPQRKYYFGVIVEMQYDYFKNDLVKFCEFLFKVLRGGLLTREFIHDMNKHLYNKGKSTTELDTAEGEVFHLAIRHDMLHQCELLIPEPNEEPINENPA